MLSKIYDEKSPWKSLKNVQKKLIEKSDSLETDANKPKWSSSSSSNFILLPNVCIFCDNDVKYKKEKTWAAA